MAAGRLLGYGVGMEGVKFSGTLLGNVIVAVFLRIIIVTEHARSTSVKLEV
jgi:hypothetical protein